jgi:hypothetical protein
MGSLSVRRDILSKHRLEKPIRSSRGKRGTRGGRRTSETHNAWDGDQSENAVGAPTGNSDNDNGVQEVDDEDEFFDAEDDYINHDNLEPEHDSHA